MRGVQISYLIDYPEYIPQLAQWQFEEWDSILGEKTPEARIKKLKTHMNRDKLPIACACEGTTSRKRRPSRARS
jgi:hypothetical protein